ncbi:MAG: DUF4058 family protein [Hormoscilla sp. SP5CHS1]|nr:DUF4058 family protein [Hormoscilla sp. SP12CHS1]MBC6453924.1 DUF4058 family protein [Hormoscilla sp. SP5CHS1]
MRSPFPGMNPYLENPQIWPQIHKRLIVAIANAMNQKLRPKYRMEIEERVYADDTNNGNSLLVGIPDNVLVQTSPTSSHSPESNVVVAALPSLPVKVTLPLPKTFKEWYLEVRDVATGAVITVIEIISPKNKKAGPGRSSYETKRQKILDSLTHFIEVDLLRKGRIMPMDSQEIKTHYRILVSRSSTRPKADLYAFNVREEIPVIPLPLKTSSEPEPMIPFQELLHTVYEQGSYDLVIDYSFEPVPKLSKADTVWADGVLRDRGLRTR